MILIDPETNGDMVVFYEENNSVDGFNIESVDEMTETSVLRVYYGGDK